MIERIDNKEGISKDGDYFRVSLELIEEKRDVDDVMDDHVNKYEIERDGPIIEKYSFSQLSVNDNINSLDTRMIVQELSGESGEDEIPEVMANDGYKWIVAESTKNNDTLADYARGANRPQVIWWDETLGTDAALWVDDDLTLCAKGTVYFEVTSDNHRSIDEISFQRRSLP